MTFQNIRAAAHPLSVALNGYDDTHAVENVVFQNVVINGQPLSLEQVKTNAFVRRITVRR